MHGSGWFTYIRHGGDDNKKPQVTRQLLLRVMAYARPYRNQIIGMLGTILITTMLGLLNPLIFREIIDGALADKDHKQTQCAGTWFGDDPHCQWWN